MLVDDETASRGLLAQALRIEGFEVVEVDTGDRAERLVRSGNRPAILITDQVMPGRVQGRDLIASMRKYSPQTGMILMSGYLDPDEVCQRSGAVTLSKPLPLGKVIRTVRAMLSGHT